MLVPCIVMAGGKGSRFGSPAKFLSEVCGESVLLRLLKQLRETCTHILIAASHHSIAYLKNVCRDSHIDCIELTGRDYVQDLSLALDIYRRFPVLVVTADLVVRGVDVIRNFIGVAIAKNVNVATGVVIRGERLEPVGLSLFKAPAGSEIWIPLPSDSVTDVDTPEDLSYAEKVCRE
jgi:GTP:adenosylcobinamide-phosphate guanylyltransferase